MKAVAAGMEQASWVLSSPHAGAHFSDADPEAGELHTFISCSHCCARPPPAPPLANPEGGHGGKEAGFQHPWSHSCLSLTHMVV